MSRDQVKGITDNITAGGSVSLVAIAILAYNTMQGIERKIDAHMQQTSVMIERLEKRIEILERRFGQERLEFR